MLMDLKNVILNKSYQIQSTHHMICVSSVVAYLGIDWKGAGEKFLRLKKCSVP